MKKKPLFGLIVIAVIVCFVLALMCGAGFLAQEDILENASEEPETAITGSEEIPAEDPVLYVNNVCIDSCEIISDFPYVDAASFCQALGLTASVSGDGADLAVNDEGVTITAEVGERYFVCNDRYFYLDAGVCSIDGDPALPVDLLADVLGLSTEWDSDNDVITVDGSDIAPVLSGDRFYDDNEVYWLSRFIFAQAGEASIEEQVALGQLILNRVASPAYEDNIYDVIFAKNQFDVVINGMIYMTPDDASVIAAKMALEGADLIGDATEFTVGANNESSFEFVIQIGDYCFYTAA